MFEATLLFITVCKINMKKTRYKYAPFSGEKEYISIKVCNKNLAKIVWNLAHAIYI